MNTRLATLLGKRIELPKSDTFKKALRTLSLTERVIFWFFISLFSISALLLLYRVNNSFLVSVPDKGGELVEGIIGSPRFVNPLLALSDADKDLSTLVYSGLLKATPEGKLVPDLAESFSISDDGKVYSFILKKNIRFHDGTPITTDDIEFTITKAQDPSLKSPRRANWEGVSIEKVSRDEIRFTLQQPYAPFIENATLGILPKHIWRNASAEEFSFSEYNVIPIGSGPFIVKNVGKNSAGIPNEYFLGAFSKYALGEPFISNIVMRFYPNESELALALEQGDIDSASGLSAKTIHQFSQEGFETKFGTLPRIFGVFFNQSQASVFSNKEVRQALNIAVDKESIIHDVLYGYGSAIDSPLPFSKETPSDDTLGTSTDKIEQARNILEKAGWKMNEETKVYEKKTKKDTFILAFSLSTGDAPELKKTAEKIKADWEKIGAQVSIQIFDTSDLNQNIIRPRKYDALLFGEIIGRDRDLYPFWHSSQRNDPGLNIALYVNNKADKLLEEARATSDRDLRDEKNRQFEEEIKNDSPVVFLYSPTFLYIAPRKIENISLGELTVPGDRFLNIHTWFIEKNKVWKLFTD